MLNQPKYGSTPDSNNVHSQNQDTTRSRATATRLNLAGIFVGVAVIGLLGYGYNTTSPTLSLLGQTGRGQQRFFEQAFDPTLLVDQYPPPPPPVQDHCEVLEFFYPLSPNAVGRDNLSSRGTIYSADSAIANKDGSFSVGPAIGAQFETFTFPQLDDPNVIPTFSKYVNGMFLLDPIIDENSRETTYQSSISYNTYIWTTPVHPIPENDFTYVAPTESAINGGTGKYFGTSGIYNYQPNNNLYKLTGTDNKFGIFYLGRLVTCDSCQAFSPKPSKKSKE